MSRAQVTVVVAGLWACGTPEVPKPEPPAVTAHPADALATLDARIPVPLLPPMALHQKQNMQDHLLVMQQITDGLAREDWPAIEAAAGRFASSPQMQMQCEHMGMGAEGFTDRALDFHRRADGIVAAAKAKDGARVLAATATTLEACASCHATYRQDVVTEAAWRERTGSAAPTQHH